MSLDTLRARIPDYAKDIKLNLGGVLTPGHLSETQVWGTALASAIAARNAEVTAVIAAEAKAKLSPQVYAAAQSAAAVMANNIYYRFTHLLPQGEYGKLPARLRMNAIATHGIEKRDIELFSLAVSAVNGCGLCLETHEREVPGKGASREQVQDAVRIAAVIHAVATVLDAEAALGVEARAAA
jgi:alkyl hydroperoxide reductase subunit D